VIVKGFFFVVKEGKEGKWEELYEERSTDAHKVICSPIARRGASQSPRWPATDLHPCILSERPMPPASSS